MTRRISKTPDDLRAPAAPQDAPVSAPPLGGWQTQFPIPPKVKNPRVPEPKLWEPKPFVPAKPGGRRTLEDPVYDPYTRTSRPWGDFRLHPEKLRRPDIDHPGEWFDPAYFAEVEAIAAELPPPAHARDPSELELQPIADLKKAPKGSSKGLKNILEILSKATPEEIDYWRYWYGFAHLEAVKLARTHERPVDLVAGVIAVLSPKEFWEQNLYLADRALAQDWANVKALDPSREKAYALVVDGDFSVIAGEKVYDFFLSIVDPVKFMELVVVDTHAINIWRGVRAGEAPQINRSERKQIVADYTTAGRMAGLSPQATQAITWTLWRQFAAAGGWDASQQQDESAWGKGRSPETFSPEDVGDLSDDDFEPPAEPVRPEHFAGREAANVPDVPPRMWAAAKNAVIQYVPHLAEKMRSGKKIPQHVLWPVISVDVTDWRYADTHSVAHLPSYVKIVFFDEPLKDAEAVYRSANTEIWLGNMRDAVDLNAPNGIREAGLAVQLSNLRHELIHWVQDALSPEDNVPGGLPKKTFDGLPGPDKELNAREHLRQDTEFYPLVQSDADEFLHMHPQPTRDAIRQWVASSAFFNAIKTDLVKWRKAVAAFLRLVEQPANYTVQAQTGRGPGVPVAYEIPADYNCGDGAPEPAGPDSDFSRGDHARGRMDCRDRARDWCLVAGLRSGRCAVDAAGGDRVDPRHSRAGHQPRARLAQLQRRADLVRFLEENGCRLLREGGRHSAYVTASGARIPIPHHRTISPGVVASVLRTADLYDFARREGQQLGAAPARNTEIKAVEPVTLGTATGGKMTFGAGERFLFDGSDGIFFWLKLPRSGERYSIAPRLFGQSFTSAKPKPKPVPPNLRGLRVGDRHTASGYGAWVSPTGEIHAVDNYGHAPWADANGGLIGYVPARQGTGEWSGVSVGPDGRPAGEYFLDAGWLHVTWGEGVQVRRLTPAVLNRVKPLLVRMARESGPGSSLFVDVDGAYAFIPVTMTGRPDFSQLDALSKTAGVTVEPKRPQVNLSEIGVAPGQGVENILAVLRAATPEEIDYWARWYHHAKEDVGELASKHNVPFEIAAAVVAVLSPGNKWFMNLRAADLVLTQTPRAPSKKRKRAVDVLNAWIDAQARTYIGYLALQLENDHNTDDPSVLLAYVGEVAWDPSDNPPFPDTGDETSPREYDTAVYQRAREILAAQIPPAPAKPKRKRKAEEEQDPVVDDIPGYTTPEQQIDFPGVIGKPQPPDMLPALGDQIAPEVAPGINAYPANVKKAQQIIATGDTSLVTGPKVVEFFQSLMNPASVADRLVLDGHAINIWRGEKRPLKGLRMPNKREREQMLADYQKAAEIAGLPVQSVQAITWYIWKHTVDSPQLALFAIRARLAELTPEQIAAYEREWQEPRDVEDVLKEVEFLIQTRGPLSELIQIREQLRRMRKSPHARAGLSAIGEIELDAAPAYSMLIRQHFPGDVFDHARLVGTDDIIQIASALHACELRTEAGQASAYGPGVELRFVSARGGLLQPEAFDALVDAVADASLHLAAVRQRVAEVYPRVAIDFSEVVPGRIFLTTTDLQSSFGGDPIPAGTALAFEGVHWPGHDGYFGITDLPDLGGTRIDNMRLRFVPYAGGAEIFVLSPKDLAFLQKGEVDPATGDLMFDPEEESSARQLFDDRVQQYMSMPPRHPEPVMPVDWDYTEVPDEIGYDQTVTQPNPTPAPQPAPPAAAAPSQLVQTNVQRRRPMQTPQASKRYAAAMVFLAGDREYIEWQNQATPDELRRWARQYAVRLDHAEELDEHVTFYAPPVVGRHGAGRHALRVFADDGAQRIAAIIEDA